MDGGRVVMMSALENDTKGRGLKLFLVMALVYGRNRMRRIERRVRWFCGNAVIGSERGCAAELKGRKQGFR
jgi:hypothetical protein